jgi:hypothetical protein
LVKVAFCPLCDAVAFHACVIVWLPAHAHVRCHPLIAALPVLVIVTAPVKPLPQSVLTLYATRHAVTLPPPDVGVGCGVALCVGVGLGVPVEVGVGECEGVGDGDAPGENWMPASICCLVALAGVASYPLSSSA